MTARLSLPLLLLTAFVAAACPSLRPLSAQIVILNTDAPESGTSAVVSTSSGLGSIDLNQTGPNHEWDFTGLTPEGQTEVKYENSASTPYSFYFFGSFGTPNNSFEFINTILSIANFEISNIYDFFQNRQGGFTASGRGLTIAGFPAPTYYYDQDEVLLFPLEYGDEDNTTFRYSASVPTIEAGYSSEGTRRTVVDGWGTIKLPIGEFECLRVRSEIEFQDTVTVPVELLPIQLPINKIPLNYTRVEYKWLTKEKGIPLLQVLQTVAPLGINLNDVQWQDTDRRPVAQFSSNAPATAVCAPLTVAFSNQSIRASSYEWDFGDGFTSTQSNPTHVYTEPGTYNVTLRAVNEMGEAEKTMTSLVRVKTLSISNFNASATTAAPGDGVRFWPDNQSPSVHYRWDFGDGFQSEETAPTHYYRFPGLYTVTLHASDVDGCEGSLVRSNWITIGTTSAEEELAAAALSLSVAPNPSKPGARVMLTLSDVQAPIDVRVFDLSGRLAFEVRGLIATGSGYRLEIPSDTSLGVYQVEVSRNGAQTATARLVLR